MTNNQKIPKWIKRIVTAAILACLVYGYLQGQNASLQITNESDQLEYVYPSEAVDTDLQFRTEQKLEEHFQKHVIEQQEFGDISVEDYLYFAQELMTVVEGEDTLTKEIDGETLYYDAETNEFGVLSSDGYIKTFFKPSDGQAYFDRQ